MLVPPELAEVVQPIAKRNDFCVNCFEQLSNFPLNLLAR